MATSKLIIACSMAVILLIIALQITIARLTLDQRLIVACHHVDIETVKTALKDGANVNATFGSGDCDRLFGDRWDCGYAPIVAGKWTPLLAVANSDRYPPPPRRIRRTPEDLIWARGEKMKISADALQKRAKDAVDITQLLIDHKANLNADDGFGGTALYKAIYSRKLELSKLLINAGANVNTRTEACFCGTYEITPLHRAIWSEELVKLLLERGADRNAKDSEGDTPADWVRSSARPMELWEFRTTGPMLDLDAASTLSEPLFPPKLQSQSFKHKQSLFAPLPFR
ncbi:ankyrin repeat domain-containing protein [Lacunimicrobium album]